MNVDDIKELVSFLEKSTFNKIRVKQEDGFELELDKAVPTIAMPVNYRNSYHQMDYDDSHHMSHKAPSQSEAPVAKSGIFITSPMVGTFYSAPATDQPAFVKVGDRVEENTVVCIIEAMKVMNEVKAGKSGVVLEVLVDNAHPVEFGTKLFQIQ